MKGRKADPIPLKIIKGQRTGRDSGGRVIPTAPSFVRYAPEKPEDLSTEASHHWDEIVPELTRANLLQPGNVGGLVAMCESWARMLLAKQDVEEKGLTIRVGEGTPTARPIRNPSLVTLEKASNEYRTWVAEFGLTPSSEGRLGIREATPRENNPFAPKEGQA